MNGKRLLMLPRYTELGPSSRIRMYQYLPALQEAGYEISIQPFFSDSYMTALYGDTSINAFSVLHSYFKRIFQMIGRKDFDLIWLQQELFPWIIPGLEKAFYKRSIPMIVDYDDAVFHRYDMHSNALVRAALSSKIDRVMQASSGLTVGNRYLAEHAAQAGASSIQILPSVVDTDHYAAVPPKERSEFVIGWIGTPKTVHFLELIQPALAAVLDERTRCILVGAQVLDSMRDLPIESQLWREDSEVAQIQQFDVGIMPLLDAPFERGKCGYKLIQYMACGLPVVASPVGVNQEIVEPGINGYLASSMQEWVNAFTQLKTDHALRQKLGLNGRKKVEQYYSLASNTSNLLAYFSQIIGEAAS